MPDTRAIDGQARDVVWEPNPGPQSEFLATPAYEALYGGAAGGGKSDALLVGGLRYVHNPAYTGIIFRRKFPDLEKSLIERARKLIPRLDHGATYNDAKHFWRFSSKARLLFSHMEQESDRFDHQGAEYQYVGIDELTHFTERQYTYLLSRARSSSGIPIRIRAATNPGGEGHEWVKRRWGPWLDPESHVRAAPGQLLYYVNTEAGEQWVPRGTPDALSRVFIPARLSDNPKLTENDPGYRGRLMGLDRVTRAQLLDGNWLIKAAAGELFKRGWFEVVERAPSEGRRVRYWDRAATEVSDSNADPDWTRGVRVCRSGGLWFVESIVSLRGRPAAVEDLVLQTARLDGMECQVGIEQDPGQAGVFEADTYVRLLAGFDVRCYPARVDKETRARPVSAQAEAKNIKLVRGPWHEAFLAEAEAFPDSAVHDDQIDALSGAVAATWEDDDYFKQLIAAAAN